MNEKIMENNRCLWFCVTNDKYELPISPIFDNGTQLAKFLGVSVNKVYSYECPSKIGRVSVNKDGEPYKIVKARYSLREWRELLRETRRPE